MCEIQPQKVLHLYKEKEKKKPNIDKPYIITEKFDGWYVFIDYHVCHGWGYVRNESRVIPSMMFTRDRFINSIPTPKVSCRFIMEAYIPGQEFHVTNGIFNRKNEDAKDVKFIIHDWIPLDSYWVDREENTAFRRSLTLHSLPLPLFREDEEIGLAETLDISKFEDVWQEQFDIITNRGGEGIILKATRHLYQPGVRNSSLMKMKLEEDFDLLVTDMYWTTGEKGNNALNLKLQNAEGIKVPVRVGKDKDILHFTTKESPIGKVAKIACMKKLPDGSYREPRFRHIRWDKQPHEID